MKRALLRSLATCLLAAASAASAQQRTIPPEAPVGWIRYVESMQVEIDGVKRALSPGVQIRDADNRLVLPASLQQREQVRYLFDGTGLVFRVWMMTEAEKASLPPPPSPFPK